jgi:FKBP-type peptidyl-prolyl cis-trans isomerase
MNTKRFSYLIIFILLGYTFSISAQSEPLKAKLPVTGAEFEYLKKGTGQKGKIGEYIQFGLLVFGNDGQVLADRRKAPQLGMDQIKEIDSTTIPIVELVYSLEVGDSVRMVVQFQEGNKPQGLEHLNSLIYVLKCEKIIDELTMQAMQEEEAQNQAKKMEAGKEIEAKVAITVADLINKYKAGELKESIIKTKSGLEYFIIEKAKGIIIQANEMVSVDYYGALIADAKAFDNSFGRGEKLKFTAGAGQMIKGWDEAMLLLGHGDKAILFIPYDLAYGEAGRPPVIPEKANLAFYIEIE